MFISSAMIPRATRTCYATMIRSAPIRHYDDTATRLPHAAATGALLPRAMSDAVLMSACALRRGARAYAQRDGLR